MERRFWIILTVLAVFLFVAARWGIGYWIAWTTEKQFALLPLEERGVYDYRPYRPRDDVSFLVRPAISTLTGLPVASAAYAGLAMAVIVENYSPIRGQQSGLSEASVIYETPAEGGITRLLAVFDGAPAGLIGPVRSARPYFISWASEYRAAFVHVGGSAEALNNLASNFRILSIDEFSDSPTIWRDSQYLAPHNAYTSAEEVQKRMEESHYFHPLSRSRFLFKNPDAVSGDITVITIPFSIQNYEVKYEYDPATHRYLRFNGGKRHHDLSPANVLIQFTDQQVLDDAGRLRIQTNGAGKAFVFRDGRIIEGVWQKDTSVNTDDQPDSSSYTRFFDKDGKEIPLNRGQTFIEVIPNGETVNYF